MGVGWTPPDRTESAGGRVPPEQLAAVPQAAACARCHGCSGHRCARRVGELLCDSTGSCPEECERFFDSEESREKNEETAKLQERLADEKKKFAEEQKGEAERQTRIATAQRLAVQANAVGGLYPRRSVLLAAEAVQLSLRTQERPITVRRSPSAKASACWGERLSWPARGRHLQRRH